MGFIDDVDRIAALTPKTRQTVLFSATFETAIARLAARLLRDPVRVDVKAEKSAPLAIEQRVHYADDHAHKHRLLDHLLADTAMGQSIVFIATKRDAEALATRLQGQGHAAAALHGDMNQRERTRTLQDMRRGGVRTLVATDVAARGIDVAGISHVINFDLPREAEGYVHRIGRTGRAGATGIAVSLAHHHDRGALRQIERYTGFGDSRARHPGPRAARPLARRRRCPAQIARGAPASSPRATGSEPRAGERMVAAALRRAAGYATGRRDRAPVADRAIVTTPPRRVMAASARKAAAPGSLGVTGASGVARVERSETRAVLRPENGPGFRALNPGYASRVRVPGYVVFC